MSETNAYITLLVLLAIGVISGAYVGFFLGVFYDRWTKEMSRRFAQWVVDTWYGWRTRK